MDTKSIFNCDWCVEDLMVMRAQSIENEAAEGREVAAFTCDQCESRYKCAFVFDAYNTDGDCICYK